MCDCGRAGKNSAGSSGTSGAENADGSVAVQFGACDGRIPNCLSIVKRWNYVRPQSEILNGTWNFPDGQPLEAGTRALQ
jgi:hypothetical protein